MVSDDDHVSLSLILYNQLQRKGQQRVRQFALIIKIQDQKTTRSFSTHLFLKYLDK